MSSPDCLFCKIVDGAIPADIVGENDRFLAFRDIAPQAPVHFLVIPREHVKSLDRMEDESLVGGMMLFARDMARQEGVAENGFRVVLNTNNDGGQTVHHIHAHVLGGRGLSWPPG
jgi:histidine triad (HIT) family protein